MPDYNIYIHAVGGTSESPTTPFSQRKDSGGYSPTESQSNFDIKKAIMSGASYAQNPDSLVSKGTGALAKAVPWIAVAVAVVKTATFAFDNALEFATIESGDYRLQTDWENLKNSFRIAMTPVSSTVQAFKTMSQWRKENEKRTMSRDLLGDSNLNTLTKVGV